MISQLQTTGILSPQYPGIKKIICLFHLLYYLCRPYLTEDEGASSKSSEINRKQFGGCANPYYLCAPKKKIRVCYPGLRKGKSSLQVAVFGKRDCG
jgi:hypothetical protein